MPIPFKKYIKRKRRLSRRRDVRRIDPKANEPQIDLTEREKEFNELLVDGNVPTKRKKDGTIVLREITGEEGIKVADDSIDQLVPVDMYQQNYNEAEVDKVIDNELDELLPDTIEMEEKIKKFFTDYNLLKEEIDAAGEDSHQSLVDSSLRFIPQPEPVEKIPIPENILGNGVFEDGELPEITSKTLNHEIIDDPTDIRPTAKILRFWGSKPGHMIIHKKEDAKLKRGGLYECSYLIYVSEDYDGSHGVEFTTWKNLDPDLTIMTPIGNLPYDSEKQIMKGRWLRRNFWVKQSHKGEPTDFNWKLGYPMGVRPKGVKPGDAMGSSIYRINLHKNYDKPKKEDFLQHKRLGMLWKEMADGNLTMKNGGQFEGLTAFFKKISDDLNDRFYRAKLMGTEVDGTLKEFTKTVGRGKKKKKVTDWKMEHVPEGEQSVGKTVHPLSIHDKGKHFEIWFAIKDVTKNHHMAILEDIMKRFEDLEWQPSTTDQEMFDEPKEIFDASIKTGDMPAIQVVTQNPPPQNINITQPEIGMTMDGVNVKQDGTNVTTPVGINSSTGVSTDVAGASMTTQGMSSEQIRKIIQEELAKSNVGTTSSGGGGGGAKKSGGYTFKKAGADIKDAASKGGALGKKLLGAPGQLVGNVVGGALGIAKAGLKAVGSGLKKVGKGLKKGIRKVGRALRRIFRRPRFRWRRRRRRRWSDIRLKQNINYITTLPNGINVYDYNYIWSNKKHRGVMAQELIKLYPEAVKKNFGLYSVDYSKIYINFEDLNYG